MLKILTFPIKSFNKYDFLIDSNNSKKEFIKTINIFLRKIKLLWV